MATLKLDHDALTREWLLALRGRQSQRAFSLRAGHTSNVAHRWETGERVPRIHQVLHLCRITGRDVRAAAHRVHAPATKLAAAHEVDDPAWARAFLVGVCGQLAVREVAEGVGVPYATLGRVLRGEAACPAPLFLAVVDHVTGVVLDFLAALVPIASLPSATAVWTRQQAERELSARYPWCHPMQRMLSCASYLSRPQHDDAWMADALSAEPGEVREALDALEAAGLVRFDGSHYHTVGRFRILEYEAASAVTRRVHAWMAAHAARETRLGRGRQAFHLAGFDAQDLLLVADDLYAGLKAASSRAKASGGDRMLGLMLQIVPFDGEAVNFNRDYDPVDDGEPKA
ncbi:MAG: hypothetical protein H6733_11845 [Alphaproteobacteria bacterium]|nr:hypothetical protein [Alphaproteobacteria bacterium]